MSTGTAPITKVDSCRCCGSKNLAPLFSLGTQYVSDFVTADRIHSGVKCPIELELCDDCTLVQAKYTAPQELLYTRHYWYRSGINETMRIALHNITAQIVQRIDLKLGDIVLDIGSNDGTLLRSYSRAGLHRVGFEPALNLAEEGSKGVDLITDFWNADKYPFEKKAKVITAIGMFYDLPDPNKFIEDIARTLAPDGLFVSQLMCLANMVSMRDVGNMAHEHLEFYSIRSLLKLFEKYGLHIFDIQRNSVNGESYRIYAGHAEGISKYYNSNTIAAALAADSMLDDSKFYKHWFLDLKHLKDQCVDFIESVEASSSVWVYGASTKGNVILQWYGMDHLIEGAADRSPEKHGLYTAGTGIPIFSEEHAREQNPDYFLALPYSFRSEFMRREQEWRSKGGKFIFPLPQFEVV